MNFTLSPSVCLTQILTRTLRTGSPRVLKSNVQRIIAPRTYIPQRYINIQSNPHIIIINQNSIPSPSQPSSIPTRRIHTSSTMTTKETSLVLSRTPTPTLQNIGTLDPPSDIDASSSATDVSETDEDENPSSSDDDEELDAYGRTPYFLDRAIFDSLLETLTSHTTASTDATVGTSTLALRKYYSQKLQQLAADPTYANTPLTEPPCPHVVIKAVDQVRYEGNCEIDCPCCLPDDLPQLKIIAEEVEGGVVTYGITLEKLREWLYGNPHLESEDGTDTELAAVVDKLPAGEAGVLGWNSMSEFRREGKNHIMHSEIYLYYGKPLIGGGMHDSEKDTDTDGCGRQ
ncbi:hypothetical protein AA313_de0207429 [Arthrobotrys entomopaga]|nr:hypothetical protein AA313_de0207429 [Arthrobotrys entomopaga]